LEDTFVKYLFVSKGGRREFVRVREGGEETNPNSLGAVSRSRVDTELFPSHGSVEQCISSIPWETRLLTNTQGLILHCLYILCMVSPGLQYQSA